MRPHALPTPNSRTRPPQRKSKRRWLTAAVLTTAACCTAWAQPDDQTDRLEHSAASSSQAAPDLPELVTTLAWGSLDDYLNARNNAPYAELDWIVDGCSAPKLLGLGYNDLFRPACELHDFGYRNVPGQTPTTDWERAKSRTDQVFLDHMNAICEDAVQPVRRRPTCHEAARLYYLGVRDLGWPVWIYNGALAALR